VIVVVLYHFRVGPFSGGFIGVDVFLVLSGFLITRLLLKEMATTGRVALPAFWARRARRLLPASVLVLVVTVLVAQAVFPPLRMRNLAVDAMASGGFVANFVFAGRGDYFAAQLAAAEPSPLTHYWSLALEEQFYLVWPLVLVALTRRPRQYRRLLVAVIGLGAAASLLASVLLTRDHHSVAYYLLPARMGELLAGAAIAVSGTAFASVQAPLRAAFGWFGVVGIVAAATLFDASTQSSFPGTNVLLPVLATVLVLAAGGAGSSPSGPTLALRNPGLQWVGRHSYAIYLWHWPVLVLAEAKWGPQPLPVRLVLMGVAVGCAMVSLRFVEDPVRHWRSLAAHPSRGLALGAGLCTLAIVAGMVGRASIGPLATDQVAAAPVLSVPPSTASTAPTVTAAATTAPATGAAAVEGFAASASTSTTTEPAAPAALVGLAVGGSGASDLSGLLAANRAVLEQGLAVTDVPANLRPSLGSANGDRAAIYADGCVAVGRDTELTPCRYGNKGAATTIVLYGDSHAAQWFPAFRALAEDRGYELIVLTKGGCPVAAVSIPTATLARTCPIWRDAAIEFLAAERPDVIVTTNWADYPNPDDEWARGFDATIARLVRTTNNLVVLGDIPPADVEPATCLSANLRSVDNCTAERADVTSGSRLGIESEITARYGGRFVDTTDWICTDTRCPIIIGDILLYRDATHITTVAAEWFRPLVEASLAGIV
jgi:peptidoglycan/LPS O-acetylase OafA/YrhL